MNGTSYTTITSHLTTNTALVGTAISKYGSYGGYASGTITAVNSSVSYNTGVTLYGMMQITLTNGSIVAGDSGGPVYSGTKFYGVVSGKSGSTIVWASPVYSSTGFSLLN